MNIEEERKLEERRRKKLVLLASDSPLWVDISSLETKAGFSLAKLRNAALPERWGKATPSKASSSKRKPAGNVQNKTPSAADVPVEELRRISAKLGSAPSSREELLAVSAETLRKMSQGLLRKGHRAHQSLDALKDALTLAARLFGQPAPDTASTTGTQARSDPAARHAWCAALAEDLLVRVNAFMADLAAGLAESVRVYDAGWRFLGLGIQETQERVDKALFATRPLLTKPYRSDWDTVLKEFKEVQGFYHAWLGRFVGSERFWLRCCVHVRYPLEVAGGYVIRAKLNVPVFNPNSADYFDAADRQDGKEPAHEYDGFCDVQSGGRIYWVWEKRSRSREDYAFWITTPRFKEGPRKPNPDMGVFTGCTGQYLTCHQDTGQTIVNGPLVLEPDTSTLVGRHPLREDYEVMARKKMWGDPMTVQAGHPEFHRISKLAAALGLVHHELDEPSNDN